MMHSTEADASRNDTTYAARRVPESAYWAMKDQPDSLATWIAAFAANAIAGGKK